METEVHWQGTVNIRRATAGDVKLLQDIGIQTFYDTFAEVNTKADMDQYLEMNFNDARIILELADTDNLFFVANQTDNLPAMQSCAKEPRRWNFKVPTRSNWNGFT